MRHILVIGAGRSATNLIHYLAEKASDQQLEITVADLSLEAANKNILGMMPHPERAFQDFHKSQDGKLILDSILS